MLASPFSMGKFGEAVVGCRPDQWREQIERLASDAQASRDQVRRGLEFVRRRYGSETYLASMNTTKGRFTGNHSAAKPTVLFFPSNGVGLGHLSRLMAIAKRCPSDVRVVFATMVPAVHLIEKVGWICEYVNSPSKVNDTYRHWNAHLEHELAGLIRFHSPQVIVYDGNALPEGLVKALHDETDIGLVWVRNGMWGNWRQGVALHYLSEQKHCDLVIEADDLASANDQGVTATHRDMVPQPGAIEVVPPIALVTPAEALSREEARKRLGIRKKRAVLVSFGAGSLIENYDIVDAIITQVGKLRGTEIVVAQHPLSNWGANIWPGVLTVDVFPLSEYLLAFDAAIAESGYNTFHDLIDFRVPTIFIPSQHEASDRQLERAEWAQEKGFALCASAGPPDNLDQHIRDMIDRPARRGFDKSSRGFLRGAERAADLVADLAKTFARSEPSAEIHAS